MIIIWTAINHYQWVPRAKKIVWIQFRKAISQRYVWLQLCALIALKVKPGKYGIKAETYQGKESGLSVALLHSLRCFRKKNYTLWCIFFVPVKIKIMTLVNYKKHFYWRFQFLDKVKISRDATTIQKSHG